MTRTVNAKPRPEDFRTSLCVEIHDLLWTQAQPQTQRDDSARRSAHDQIEVVRDVHGQVFLDAGEYGRREQTFDAASIE